ncbi:hypothetical protein HaLaN_02655 [Haematococcus lacustris]|uniref:Uncharacterized protein n=1 Tax=Haematococcus lacustris TaxID=44745 RepID=A0A699YIS6_HAELA|nr:hypothetical protein HaLaN_02655 [Haematococcus lacustris]
MRATYFSTLRKLGSMPALERPIAQSGTVRVPGRLPVTVGASSSGAQAQARRRDKARRKVKCPLRGGSMGGCSPHRCRRQRGLRYSSHSASQVALRARMWACRPSRVDYLAAHEVYTDAHPICLYPARKVPPAVLQLAVLDEPGAGCLPQTGALSVPRPHPHHGEHGEGARARAMPLPALAACLPPPSLWSPLPPATGPPATAAYDAWLPLLSPRLPQHTIGWQAPPVLPVWQAVVKPT